MSLTAPDRRELTPFEWRLATIAQAATWLTVGALFTWTRLNGLVAIGLLAALALVVFPQSTAWYANRSRPRFGPDALRRSYRPWRVLRARAGVGWGRGLALPVLGLVMLALFVLDVHNGRSIQHDLARRGVAVEATVSGLTYDQDGIDRIQVAYTVDGQQVQHNLQMIGSMPSGLHRGSSLAVDYDPQAPARVMLRSQVHGGMGTELLFLAFIVGFTALGFVARRRSRSDPSSGPTGSVGWGVSWS